jgi:NitT/TauT family transport system substrate-binding protein
MKNNRFFPFAIIALFACISPALFAAGSESKNANPATVKVAALAGPSGIGMAYLFSNPPDLGAGTITSFEVEGSVDVLLPKLVSGDIDIGILPPNVAAKLYNKAPNLLVAGAVVGNGMISLITTDPAISSFGDLAGKTVSVAGQGSTPEYVARTLIAKNGIAKDSITLDFSIPTPEIAAALISGKISAAIVPEPFATVAVLNGASAGKNVRRAILFRESWKTANLGDDFPMTLCVIRKDFAQKNPELVRKFLNTYKASIEWTVANPADAGKLVETAGIGLKAPIAAKAIPSCNLVFIPAAQGRASIEKLLGVFLEYAPESVGGKLPDDGFYFK